MGWVVVVAVEGGGLPVGVGVAEDFWEDVERRRSLRSELEGATAEEREGELPREPLMEPREPL